MATLTPVNPELIQSDNPMETTTKKILNGQSWKTGQWLFTNTSDLLKTCASDADSGTGGIKYIALADQDDPGDSTTEVEVGIITQDMVFLINELDGTVADTDVGGQYAIDVTSNVVTVDIDDTTNIAVEMLEREANLSPAKYGDDTKAKVRVKVIPAALEAVQQA